MKILEIKNSLVKISYDVEDDLALSGFAIIEDTNTPYVAQIVNLKAENGRNFAVLKLLFTFNDEGVLKAYNGTIPSLEATVTKLPPEELLSILPMDNPIYLGLLAQQDTPFKLDSSVLDSNLLICSNNVDNTSKLLSNILPQLVEQGKKVVLFDVNGDFASEENFIFGKNFKLPLNSAFLDYIFEKDLEGVEPVSKAVIQDIFKEVQDYLETLPDGYLPIDLFINVVQQQYNETGIPELVLLKNKLIKYRDNNVFAAGNDDVKMFRSKVAHSDSLIVDISDVELSLQKVMIPYLFDSISTVNSDLFVLITMNNEVADKKLLRKTLEFKNIFTTIICGHEFKYLPDLKQIIQNLILFAPQTLQHDFAAYNTFLGKLNTDEFIVYGPATQNMPFIVKVQPYEELIEMDKTAAAEEETMDETAAEQTEQPAQNVEYIDTLENNPFAATSTMEVTAALPVEEVTAPKEETALPEEEPELPEEEPELPEELLNAPQEEPEEDVTSIENFDFEIPQDYSENEEVQKKPEADTVTDLSELPDLGGETMEEQPFQEVVSDVDEVPTFEQEALEDREILEAQVAKDVDDALYRKFEEETLDNENDINPDVLLDETSDQLSDSDLDFIQSMPMEEAQEVYSSEEFSPEDAALLEQPSVEDLESSVLDEGVIEELEVDNSEVFEETDNTGADESQMVPIYTPEEINDAPGDTPLFISGDVVSHPKYGQGVVEKMINYGNKTLCSISFVNIGRRLLDPNLSDLSLVSRDGIMVN